MRNCKTTLLRRSTDNLTPSARSPDEVVIEGVEEVTPVVEEEEDFFSSWDKPAIKRPTPPPTRTATPPVVGRTGSPALTLGSSIGRPKSPLGQTSTPATTPISRTTTSSAIRSATTGTATKKTSILGAKKATKLGAKKAAAVEDDFDFEAAEKKAEEEAERIEKLGYDPEAEKAKEEEKAKKAPAAPAASNTSAHARKTSDVERLGLSMNKLGFGQVTSPAAAAAPKRMGFGSVGGGKTAAPECKFSFFYHTHPSMLNSAHNFTADDDQYAREKFGGQKAISSDEFFGRNQFDPQAQAEARTRLKGFDGATSISSNQYFGISESDDLPEDDSLEGQARQLARKYVSEDLDSVTQALGQGAAKLQDALKQYVLQG